MREETTVTEGRKPNILVIWGDDIGTSNLSCYTRRLMGYQTPNIDRLAGEGMMFTDSYGEQSCTAGRACSSPASRVSDGAHQGGRPGGYRGPAGGGSDHRRTAKAQGYATGQFGKNHLGDRNEYLPTVHGFD
jgi:arylsulfatase